MNKDIELLADDFEELENLLEELFEDEVNTALTDSEEKDNDTATS